eukprot:11777297-Alexandrium_andersonii.AAC.1
MRPLPGPPRAGPPHDLTGETLGRPGAARGATGPPWRRPATERRGADRRSDRSDRGRPFAPDRARDVATWRRPAA